MELKQKIINSFNSGAYTYEAAADIQKLCARQLSMKFPTLTCQTILEIGCGTGMLSRYLSQYFSSSDILLTDIAEAMVISCQQRFSDKKNITVAYMDGEALNLNKRYDLIISSMTFHWFTCIQSSLRKMMQKLNQGGKLGFSMLGKNSLREWSEHCWQSAHVMPTPVFPSLHDLQQQFPDIELQVNIMRQHYSSTHIFLKTLKALGATTPMPGHKSLHAGRFRKLMRDFDKKNVSGIDISYEIIYGWYEKK